MQAKGHAGLGDSQETYALLGRAETALAGTHEQAPSEWVSRFDLGSLSSEAARCMRQLGKPAKAQEHAQRILALRTSNSTRSRAFGQLFLIATLIDQGELEEACRIIREAVEATQSLGSQLVVQQFQGVRDQLAPHAGSADVHETRQILANAVRQRVWLQQWITSDASDTQVHAR
jgi:tetratricopeptide (TPR) repeat protein